MSEEFNIKHYLKSLKKTLREKELESFYVMADRKDFKPMKGYDSPKDIMNMFAEKLQYYAGKRVADITLFTNLEGLKTGEYIFCIKIVIYKIKEDGKLSKNINDTLGLMINYEPDDFEKRKFTLKDVEKFMRLCADKTIGTETLNGIWYKKIIKILKKRGVDFEND